MSLDPNRRLESGRKLRRRPGHMNLLPDGEDRLLTTGKTRIAQEINFDGG